MYSGYCRKRWKEKVHESTLLCMITYCYNITVHTPQNIVWISSCTLLRCHTGRRGRVCGEMPFGGTFFFFGGGHWGCILLVHVGILVTIETDNQMSEILIKLGFLLVERFG